MEDQKPAPVRLVEPEARQPWGPGLWRTTGARLLAQGYAELKAREGNNLTQAQFADRVNERFALSGDSRITMTQMNNWLNGRGLPPEVIGKAMLEMVGKLAEFEPKEERQQSISTDDLALVMEHLAGAAGFCGAHGTRYPFVFRVAMHVVNCALNAGRAVSSLTTADVLDYVSTMARLDHTSSLPR